MSCFASYEGLNGRQLKGLSLTSTSLTNVSARWEFRTRITDVLSVGSTVPRHLVGVRQHACQPPSIRRAAKAEVIRHLDPSIKGKYVDNAPAGALSTAPWA
jgi:hypothetical protein